MVVIKVPITSVKQSRRIITVATVRCLGPFGVIKFSDVDGVTKREFQS